MMMRTGRLGHCRGCECADLKTNPDDTVVETKTLRDKDMVISPLGILGAFSLEVTGSGSWSLLKVIRLCAGQGILFCEVLSCRVSRNHLAERHRASPAAAALSHTGGV